MVATKEISKKSKSARSKKAGDIPAALVKETIDGIPFYYAGYRSVLNKTKTLEDIMADSGLQIDLKAYFFRLLIQYEDHIGFSSI